MVSDDAAVPGPQDRLSAGGAGGAGGDVGDVGDGEAGAAAGRRRRYCSPGRTLLVKVKYNEQERSAVARAAEVAGLQVSAYVADTALSAAQTALAERAPTPGRGMGQGSGLGRGWSARELREVLAELVAARLALRRFAVNVNQAVVLMHTGGGVPVWLQQAVQAADRAVGRVDAASAVLLRRLP